MTRNTLYFITAVLLFAALTLALPGLELEAEGLTNPEIAETLQIKLATVKSRVHRARLFLRSRLAAYVGGAPGLG